MNLHLALYGALRDADPTGYLELEVPEGCTIGELREHLVAFLKTHTSQVSESAVRGSALATTDTILHDHDSIPRNGELVILPPVSGG
ncbi:MAG: hypothetical protein EPN38_04995 [Rhodanobacteraceae bacterium]|nr:MAG: hypothetical protein EPN38_04995 [Rhodanobacteraceae bacterium]